MKDFVKENKKNAEALAGLGRAFLEIKDTASAREYATMALDRGKDNKGKALESLLMHLGIPVFDAAAIGDSDNDLSMIKSAGMGVAMGNATASIKAAANYVTKTNDEDGIAFFLDQVVL